MNWSYQMIILELYIICENIAHTFIDILKFLKKKMKLPWALTGVLIQFNFIIRNWFPDFFRHWIDKIYIYIYPSYFFNFICRVVLKRVLPFQNPFRKWNFTRKQYLWTKSKKNHLFTDRSQLVYTKVTV